MQTKKWKCLSNNVSNDMENKKWEFILTRWKKWLRYIACILFVHRTRTNSCMMEEVVAIHANDITGRPCSVQPCNTDLEESDIGCGPVSIGASAGGAATVSGKPENVLT